MLRPETIEIVRRAMVGAYVGTRVKKGLMLLVYFPDAAGASPRRAPATHAGDERAHITSIEWIGQGPVELSFLPRPRSVGYVPSTKDARGPDRQFPAFVGREVGHFGIGFLAAEIG